MHACRDRGYSGTCLAEAKKTFSEWLGSLTYFNRQNFVLVFITIFSSYNAGEASYIPLLNWLGATEKKRLTSAGKLGSAAAAVDHAVASAEQRLG